MQKNQLNLQDIIGRKGLEKKSLEKFKAICTLYDLVKVHECEKDGEWSVCIDENLKECLKDSDIKYELSSLSSIMEIKMPVFYFTQEGNRYKAKVYIRDKGPYINFFDIVKIRKDFEDSSQFEV